MTWQRTFEGPSRQRGPQGDAAVQPFFADNATLIFSVGALIILTLLVGSLNAAAEPKVKARPFMSKGEVLFWQTLRDASMPLQVLPKVALTSLVTADSALNVWRWPAVGRALAGRVADFVLIDDTGKVRLIVEIDERTHRTDEDIARFKMLAGAHYKTLRIRNPEGITYAELRGLLDDMLLTPEVMAEPRLRSVPRTTSARVLRLA